MYAHNQSITHTLIFYLGRSLTVHHAIPAVTVCPGSPGGGYYAPLPLPRGGGLRLAAAHHQLTLHHGGYTTTHHYAPHPHHAHHPQDDGM